MPSIINATTTNGVAISPDNSGSLQLATNNGTTAVTIDTSQNVGINLTPASQFSTVRGLGLAGTNGNASYITSGGSQDLVLTSNAYLNTSGNFIYVNTDAVVQQRMTSGVVSWWSAASGTAGTTASLTERMRITSSGDLVIGGTSFGAAGSFGFTPSATAPRTQFKGSSTSNTDTTLEIYSTGATAFRFYVGYGGTVYATSTTITGISDQRVKENIVDLDEGLNAVMALKPRKFDWKEGKGKGIKGDRGFIAQEFETVFPDMIEEWKDTPPEGEEPYKAVNANLIPILVKAIQEQQAMIETLKTELDTVKAELNTLKNPPVEGTE